VFHAFRKNAGMFWTVLLGLAALFWVIQCVVMARGIRRLPRLADASPLPPSDCPRVSIIFSARDEAEKLPRALKTMLALDYPDYEVVAVDDRSRDATPQILDDAARRDPRLRVVHVAELPAGWLGKTHGLQCGYEASTGEWLLFTDADVRFAPDILRRALPVARARRWDHLTLFAWLELDGFWEKTVLLYFGLSLLMYIQPWRVPDPRSRRFAGVGSFQLVRRAAYEGSGTHKRLAMEVVDDLKLGKIIKQAGFRSGVGVGPGYVTLRWHQGLANIVRGVTKNFFAASNYSLSFVAFQIVGLLAVSVVPFLGVFLEEGWARAFAAVAVLGAALLQGGAAREVKISPLYGLAHPLGALVFAYMLLRSTVVTLWRGGVVWRDTFYPLDELRKGLV